MIYTIFIDDEQKKYLTDISDGQNEIIEKVLNRLDELNETMYFVEFMGFEYYKFVLTVKRLDRYNKLSGRLIELGRLQDESFRPTLEMYEREFWRSSTY